MSNPYIVEEFRPELVMLSLNGNDVANARAAQEELAEQAAQESETCWGFFRSEENLPRSRDFGMNTQPSGSDVHEYGFSWIRFSSGHETLPPIYHLDANRRDGIARPEDLGSNLVPIQEIWRLLINLHPKAERRVAYLDAAPENYKLANDQGTVGLAPDEEPDALEERLLIIPPRDNLRVWAARVCVSRVLHAGVETPEGHFLASWTKVAA